METQQMTLQGSSPLCPEIADKVKECLKKCPDEKTFFEAYGLTKSDVYCKYRGRMISGSAPTLSTVRIAYGDAAVMDFINLFLLDLVNFCGMQQKTSAMQIDGISQIIFSRFHFFKVTELMLFFNMAKRGELRNRDGSNLLRFYGSFSGDVIMTALNAFKKYRDNIIDEALQEERRQHKEDWAMAKSEIIAPLLAKMHADMELNTKQRKEREERERQRVIDEHNAQFRKMLEAREQLHQ